MTFFDIYWAVLVFVLGLCFGSFLNVCIYRIPREKSVAWPPSACPQCGTAIRGFDNIPVLSWILLRGKCRTCKLPISVGYPLIELTTGLFFLILWLLYPVCLNGVFDWRAPVYMLAVFGLLLGTFIDLAEMWLPDRVTIGGMIVFPILSVLFPELHGAEGWMAGLKASLIGLAVGFGIFWTIRELGTAALKKEAMGFGDVKLMGSLGALLGWQAIIYILFFSALAGAVVGTTLIVMKKKELSSQIPYGPYIALAAFSWILGGYRLWEAYVALMGF
jgi:leader peptidase (prepilin peptidase)/N-methyltransferase